MFEPINRPSVKETEGTAVKSIESISLHLERNIKNVGKVETDGSQTAEGFVVLHGSHISPVDDDTIPAVLKEQRKKAPVDENGILQEDMLFSSPSYAAMFVIGKSANGLTSWKTLGGQSLKMIEAKG